MNTKDIFWSIFFKLNKVCKVLVAHLFAWNSSHSFKRAVYYQIQQIMHLKASARYSIEYKLLDFYLSLHSTEISPMNSYSMVTNHIFSETLNSIKDWNNLAKVCSTFVTTEKKTECEDLPQFFNHHATLHESILSIGTSYPKTATNFKSFYLAEIFDLLPWNLSWWLPCLRFLKFFIIFRWVVLEICDRSFLELSKIRGPNK